MHIIKTRQKRTDLKAFFRHLFSDHIFESAASLSYYFLFSIFPLTIFISAAFSTLKLSPSSLHSISQFVPDRILLTLENYLEEISLGNTYSLILTGIILTIYSMAKAIQIMKRKFRLAYGVTRKRSPFSEWCISMIFVLLVMTSFYAMLFLIVAGNQIFRWFVSFFPFLISIEPLFNLARILILSAYLFFVLLGLYYILPGIKQTKSDIFSGTLFSLVSWIATSYCFSLYLDHYSNITSLYGSLSTIIVLLIWLYIINLILIIGCKINSFSYLKRQERINEKHNAMSH